MSWRSLFGCFVAVLGSCEEGHLVFCWFLSVPGLFKHRDLVLLHLGAGNYLHKVHMAD